MVNVIVR